MLKEIRDSLPVIGLTVLGILVTYRFIYVSLTGLEIMGV